MRTEIIKADCAEKVEYAANRAAEILNSGGIVAIPTETVYGLACSIFDKSAAEQVFAVKGRPQDNPLIVHIADFSQIYDICENVPEEARILAEKFLPGPLTMILKKKDIIPDFISAGLPTAAVRIPSHPTARAVIKAAGVPLAAPSANLSGKPSTTTAEHVIADLSGKIPLIIDGGSCDIGLESTILDLTVEPPAVLRPGGISPKQISEAIGKKVIFADYSIDTDEDKAPKAPGMKYRHYAPSCPCTAVCGSPAVSADYIARTAEENDGIICFDRYAKVFGKTQNVILCGKRQNPEQFARELFDALRALDQAGTGHIYIQCPPSRGIGLAVMNRVRKSSGGDVVNLGKTAVIGVSGRSGSGKSVVSALLERHGAVHIDCDKIYNELLEINDDMKKTLDANFGGILDINGRLNRVRLAQIVFSDKSKLKLLNEITHPFVIDMVLDIIDKAERVGKMAAVIDAPALFDCDLPKLCDATIAVLCDKSVSADRICRRDNVSRETAEQRLNAQHNDEFFIKNADITVRNDSENIETAGTQIISELSKYGIKLD